MVDECPPAGPVGFRVAVSVPPPGVGEPGEAGDRGSLKGDGELFAERGGEYLECFEARLFVSVFDA